MKKGWVFSLLALLPALILGGCSFASVYSRPNTTNTQRDKDYRDCEDSAEREYPENIVYEKSDTTTTECTTKGVRTTCTSKTADVRRDLNFIARYREGERCMSIKGYERR